MADDVIATSATDAAARSALLSLALASSRHSGVGDGGPFTAWWSWYDEQGPDAAAQRLVDGFGLSRPETELVVLLLAVETTEPVAREAAAAATATGGVGGGGLPLWLACRVVPGLTTDALSLGGPLLRLGIVIASVGAPRIESRLWLAGAVVDRLSGLPVTEPALSSRTTAIPDAGSTDGEQDAPWPADRLAVDLSRALASRGPLGVPPLVLATRSGSAAIAHAVRSLGLTALRMATADLPEDPEELERLALLWSREAALDGLVLVLDGDLGERSHRTAAFVDRVLGHVVLLGAGVPPTVARGVHVLDDEPDSPVAHQRRWALALGARVARLGKGLDEVAAHFRLPEPAIELAVATAGAAIDDADSPLVATRALWHAAARAVTPTPLPGVSTLEPAFTWDDLVLPHDTEAALRRVEVHVRRASRVLDDWGFAARLGGRHSWRGRGVAALFAGPSGTGKTMAAEVIAASLDLRVMAIDISQILSKYVGETSKNIAAAFEEAERSGAVMVWNEGDAVWGTRGGVGNAVDRHLNAEVGDLLERLERTSCFTIVTTNLRQAIDPAFLRRFRFVVDFPVPSDTERLRLWRSAFPVQTPLDTLDWESLASLPLTGGAIRNVALGSAFLAAEAGTPVTREMLESELAEELRKQNLPMPRLAWADAP